MNNHIVEIRVVDLLSALWRKLWLILLVALGLGGVMFAYTRFIVPSSYTTTTRLYVVNNAGGNTVSNQELLAGSALTKDYREIIMSDDVIDNTINALKLGITSKEFSKLVTITIPADTRIISISATTTNPEEAARIANALRQEAAAKIKQVTQVSDVTTLQEARVPSAPSGPNVVRAAILGVVIGAFAMSLVIIAFEIFDDRIRKFEDLEKLEMPLLGSIPLVKDRK